MKSAALAIHGTGLVTAVGLSAPASCCAFRAKLTNPCQTPHLDAAGAWIRAHRVELDRPWPPLTQLAKMAAWAVDEALDGLDRAQWARLPLLLCVAEPARPGRLEGLDDHLLASIESELGASFASDSAIVPQGRVGVAVALARARELLARASVPGVLVVATDSLISGPTLRRLDRDDRLLTAAQSDGFMPGEGAGALWVGVDRTGGPRTCCTGIGFGREPAPIGSGQPLRADGLKAAIEAALADAGRRLHELDFRVTDLSGEQYYFKEASLAISRLLRQGKPDFDLWHPAECTGETGAAAGIAVIAAAHDACLRGHAPGPRVLCHWANDAGERAAVTIEHRT